MNKGIYILLTRLRNSKKIKTGKIKYMIFQRGYYCYVGSALNNLDKRLKRHLTKHKKMRWHIDYFLRHAEIIGVKVKITNKKEECDVNKKIGHISLKTIHKFGSSDCKCQGHLHYFKKNPLHHPAIDNFLEISRIKKIKKFI